jgi:Ser/Thr protein kinase RdoA (MazF antagonist)
VPLFTVDDLGFRAPCVPQDQIAEIAHDFFGVSGTYQALGGERDQNTRITQSDGRQFVLKISGATENPETVDFQVKALLHIEQYDPHIPVSRLIRSKSGDIVQLLESEGLTYQVRMMSFLPGIPYSSGPFPSPECLETIGAFLARLDRALAGFSHPASGAFMPWDICNGLIFCPQFRALLTTEVKQLCEPLLHRIEHIVYPRLDTLRRQVIHQDCHGSNLLRASVDSEQVAGIIDFGDMIHGPLISEVAICASHFMETGADPGGIAAAICRGFNSVTPLRDDETELLLDLVITRQILTLQLFEFRRIHLPGSPPLDAEEKPRIIRSLGRLAALDRESFINRLRTGGEVA